MIFVFAVTDINQKQLECHIKYIYLLPNITFVSGDFAFELSSVNLFKCSQAICAFSIKPHEHGWRMGIAFLNLFSVLSFNFDNRTIDFYSNWVSTKLYIPIAINGNKPCIVNNNKILMMFSAIFFFLGITVICFIHSVLFHRNYNQISLKQ